MNIFCDYVTQQKPVIDAIQENIPFPFCVSMDTKKNKRTSTYSPSPRSAHLRSAENGLNSILHCNRAVLSRIHSLEMIRTQLKALKMRCQMQKSIVKNVVVEHCCQARGTIKQVFFDKTGDGNFVTSAVQDVKHLINHSLEEIVKTHKALLQSSMGQ